MMVDKPEVELAGTSRRSIEFAKDLGAVFKNSQKIFYKPDTQSIVEIKTHYDKLSKKNITCFVPLDSKRFLNLVEQEVITFKYLQVKGNNIKIHHSPSEQSIKLVMVADEFTGKLNVVKRFLSYPMPVLTEQGELIFPKQGYNKNLQAYFTDDTPEVKLMPSTEAKEILHDILGDFCYKNDIDKIIAYSYLITPACRGLYSSITARTPIVLITANRERAGKDCLAGVQGIIYENQAVDETPISNGDFGQSNEELRKKLTSNLKGGRRRFHSANNKGLIDNAILEQFTTSEIWTDRVLGTNSTITLNNEMEISLSANVGLTYSPDFWHRCRRIELFYAEEDPNARIFKHKNLHRYVFQNRAKIISAIFSLIKEWHEAGMPSGKTPFTSFPEWAKTVGGIMQHHNLGDPCIKLEDHNIGGDKESKDMKTLFEEVYSLQQNGSDKDSAGFEKAQIMELIKQNQDAWGIFSSFDFESNKDKTKFGILLPKYVGRIFSNIRMKVDDLNKRSSRQKYFFEKVGDGNEFI